MISNDNFEIYLIDYLDGTLSYEERKQVENFLLLNPYIKEMFLGMENAVLIPPEINFPNKNKLKKLSVELLHSSIGNYDSLDGINKELITLEKDFKLKPDLNIIYPNKANLYKSPQIKVFWKYVIAVASVALLLITVSFTLFFNKNIVNSEENIQIAKESLIEFNAQTSISLLENSDPFAFSSIIINEKVQSYDKIEPLEVIPLSASLFVDEVSLARTELPTTEIIIKDEIVLTSQAQEWKSSNEVFSSKNLFHSIYEAGKSLTERIKNQE